MITYVCRYIRMAPSIDQHNAKVPQKAHNNLVDPHQMRRTATSWQRCHSGHVTLGNGRRL